jgi:hypothetical protein
MPVPLFCVFRIPLMASSRFEHGQVDGRVLEVARLEEGPVGVVDVAAGVEPGKSVVRIEVTAGPPIQFFGVSQRREEVELRSQELPLVLRFDFDQMTSVLFADLEAKIHAG